MQADERRSLALTLVLLLACLAVYFAVFVPPTLADLGRLSLSTSYDFHSCFLPKFSYGSDELRHGRFPLWNPWEYGGVPFFATAQPEVLYPPKALLFWLLSPLKAYWAFMAIHFVGLAVGFVLFAREQGIRGAPLFAGAAAWTFATPVLISNYHPTRIAILVPVPFVFLFVERWAKSRDLRAFVALVAIVTLQLVAGYPEISLDLGLLVALHAAVRFATREWTAPPWKTIPVFAAAFVLAAGISAIQLLPMVEAGVAANRAGVAKEVLDAPMAVPEAFAAPKLGIVPLFVAFALLALFKRRAVAAWAGLLACVAITSGGWLLLRRLPGLSMIRFPYVWFILAPFYGAWLVALGAESLASSLPARRIERVAVGVVAGIELLWVACCAVFFRALVRHAGAPPPRIVEIFGHNIGTKAAAALGIAAGVAIAVAAVLALLRKPWRAWWAAPLVLAVLSHLAGYPFGARSAPVKRPGRVGEVRGMLPAGAKVQGRALSIDDIAYGYEITDKVPSILGAEESFVPWRYRRILERWNFVPLFGMFDWGGFVAARGFVDAFNVQYMAVPVFVAHLVAGPDLEPIARRGGVVLFENTRRMGSAWVNYRVKRAASSDDAMRLVLDRTFDPRREVVVEDKLAWSYTSGGDDFVTRPDGETRTSSHGVEYTVTLPRQGILVASETLYPGWTAFVDSHPATLIAADYVFRGVELPPGKHSVRFEYRPRSVRYGAVASSFALAVFAALVVVDRVRRRRGAPA